MQYIDRLKQLLRLDGAGFLSYSDEKLAEYKQYVLARAAETPVGTEPYYHMYVENIFPDELYSAIERRMLYYRNHKKVKQRTQDNKGFVNRRFNLRNTPDAETRYIRGIFNDPDVKRAFLGKFFVETPDELVNPTRIHEEEFEYVYTAPGRFQNIHTDIPPKCLSFVFYIPGREVSEDEADRNGTILYDKNLTPQSKAKYRPNSVGIFAQHFHSYHGFATTTERPALVMFYVHEGMERDWVAIRADEKPPFDDFKNQTRAKLERFPLREYGRDSAALDRAYAECRINAPSGRVMVEDPETLKPTHETV